MNLSPTPDTAVGRKELIETKARLTGSSSRRLPARKVNASIPGASIAVINDYAVEWACGYGVRKVGEPDRVDTETLFQACSISKAVTAMAVLRLVEEGRLGLDADVNTMLLSWKVPANGLWQPEVTVRQLLSHTAGMSVPWFAGYHRSQDIPTLLEVLDGVQPSNTPDVRVTTMPGIRFRYAGGGYCVLQQLLIDVMQQPFPQLMRELVLSPLGMDSSTYEQPLSAQRSTTAAAGHRANGKPVAGDWYVYPEMAAAGLWTTPSDLARLALELQCAREGKPSRLLSAHMLKELLTPQSQGDNRGDMGLGIFVQGASADARFGHPGDNAGFTSCWISLMQGGRGCVLMTNSDNGWSLQQKLLRTIAQVYAWPSLPARENHKKLTAEEVADYETCVGEYELQSGLTLSISVAGRHLFLQAPGQTRVELVRQSDAVFWLANMDDTITFVRNEHGKVQALIARQGVSENVAMKH